MNPDKLTFSAAIPILLAAAYLTAQEAPTDPRFAALVKVYEAELEASGAVAYETGIAELKELDPLLPRASGDSDAGGPKANP